ITDGRMLDVVFDVTGHPAVLAPCTRLLRKLGRLVLLGDTPTPSRQGMGPRVLTDSLSILAIHALMRPDVASEFDPWTAGAMAAAGVAARPAAAEKGKASVFGGIQVGVQSYTCRAFDIDRMIAAMTSVGLTSVELWDGHLDPTKATEADFKAVRGKLDAAGIK